METCVSAVATAAAAAGAVGAAAVAAAAAAAEVVGSRRRLLICFIYNCCYIYQHCPAIRTSGVYLHTKLGHRAINDICWSQSGYQ